MNIRSLIRPAHTLILAAVALIATGCQTDTGNATKDRLGRVTNVALEHLGNDVLAIGVGALASEAQSGFSKDWGYTTTQAAYSITPEVLSSGNIADYLNAWNPATPAVNQQIAAAVQQVPIPTDPKQAAVVASRVAVTVGNNLLKATQSTDK